MNSSACLHEFTSSPFLKTAAGSAFRRKSGSRSSDWLYRNILALLATHDPFVTIPLGDGKRVANLSCVTILYSAPCLAFQPRGILCEASL